MIEKEIYNVNFLLTNQNSQRANQLVDSFINIYATTLHSLGNVDCLNVSPNHHFMQEFQDFIENYSDVERYLASDNRVTTMLIKGIKAINVLYDKEVPIFINPSLDYVDENAASFGISEPNDLPTEDSESIYLKLNNIELDIIDYGIIKGAEKVKILVRETKSK